MKILDYSPSKIFFNIITSAYILLFVFGFVFTTTTEAAGLSYQSDLSPIPSLQSQTTNPPDTNNAGGSLPVGLDFLEILPYKCLFATTGSNSNCNKDNSLLDALINFLYALATPLAVLVIMYGGYRYFFGGFTGKVEGLKTVQAAITGLVLVLTAQLITNTVNQTFNSSEGLNAEAITNLIASITELLGNLAVGAAVLVIVWGGYKYFFGGFIEKTNGLQTIQAGVTGLLFIITARFIANTLNELFKGIDEASQASELPNRIETVLQPILEQVTTVLQGLAGVVSVLVIVWGGYQYFFSTLPNGKKNGLETINKGVIGLVVTILALPIVTLVKQTLGASNEKLAIDPASIIFTIQTIVTNFLIPVSAAITVFFVILAAYQRLSAAGDASKVKASLENLRNALIGLVIVLLATTFTQLIIFIFRNTQLTPASTSEIPGIIQSSKFASLSLKYTNLPIV